MNPKASLALLVARVVTGVLLMVHGVQKLSGGIDGFFGYVSSLGVPAPQFFGSLILLGEFGIGLAFIFGVFTRIAGALLAVMFIAIGIVVQWKDGLGAENGIAGELDVTYIVIGILLMAVGAGKLSLDRVLAQRGGALAKLA